MQHANMGDAPKFKGRVTSQTRVNQQCLLAAKLITGRIMEAPQSRAAKPEMYISRQ